MKQIIISLLLLCSLTVSAQDVMITRQKKQTTSIDNNKKKNKEAEARRRAEAKRKEQEKQEQLRQEQIRKDKEEQVRAEQLRQEQEERERIEREKLSSPIIGSSSYIPNVLTFKIKRVSFQMIEVRGGTFNMGPTSEQGNEVAFDGSPVHQVTLNSYYIGKFEVTQELWNAVMGSNSSSFKGKRKPVDHVSWDDCQLFITKLNILTGKHFRLPTEAEWEFAARGGTMSRGYRYSGSDKLNDVAWYAENSNYSTQDVGTKIPNELGIYDMCGNVREYCNDFTGPYSDSPQINPSGSDWGPLHVERGGSWDCKEQCCRVAMRFSFGTSSNQGNLGLRLALTE